MKTLLTFAFTICFCGLYAQDFSNSSVNLGLGAGMNYGGVGVKTVLGARNSGLLIGVGSMGNGILGYEIGGQVAIKSFYFNLGYGVSGTYQINNAPVESVKAGNFMVGYMISFWSGKESFFGFGNRTYHWRTHHTNWPLRGRSGGSNFWLGDWREILNNLTSNQGLFYFATPTVV